MILKDKLIAKGKFKLISQISFYLVCFYFSALFFIGIIVGYIVAWYISEKANQKWKWWNQGLIPILRKRNLYLQMHHWIMAGVGLSVYYIISIKTGLNSDVFPIYLLTIGFPSGIIAQDLLTDPKWHKILRIRK